MSWFSGLLQRLGWAKKPKKRVYAGARIGRLDADWISSGTSADSEIWSSLARLRNRARQLVRDNDYARSAVRTILLNVIGKGIGLQSKVPRVRGSQLNQTAIKAIEEHWKIWTQAKRCDCSGLLSFTAMQQVVMRAVCVDGEAIVRLVRQPFGDSRIPLGLELIEADQLDEERNGRHTNGNVIRLGIELDPWRRPVAYWLRTVHPGDNLVREVRRDTTIRVPAGDILHLYICERPGQTRGVSWFASALQRVRNLGGYEEAELVAARGAASIMGFVQSPDADVLEKLPDGRSAETLEPGVIKALAPGEIFQGFAPTRPSEGFGPFVTSMLRGLAAGIGTSYEPISRDYSQSNYSSSRLSLLEDREHWKWLQSWLTEAFLQPVFEAWLDMAVLSGVLPFPDYEGGLERYRKCRWQVRGWGWIDPYKEIQGCIAAVEAGLTTLTDEVAKQGGDFEELLKTRSQELEMARQYGVQLANAGVVQGQPAVEEVGDGQDY
ncbi:MAG: hypothetical protein DDT26_00095 [Dehalococcoidia bacterium]|nr:hypothetical protein [Chloroflexota bacterium]